MQRSFCLHRSRSRNSLPAKSAISRDPQLGLQSTNAVDAQAANTINKSTVSALHLMEPETQII